MANAVVYAFVSKLSSKYLYMYIASEELVELAKMQHSVVVEPCDELL